MDSPQPISWPALTEDMSPEDDRAAVWAFWRCLNDINDPHLNPFADVIKKVIISTESLYSLSAYLHRASTNPEANHPIKQRITEDLPGFTDGSLLQSIDTIIRTVSALLVRKDLVGEERSVITRRQIFNMSCDLERPLAGMTYIIYTVKAVLEYARNDPEDILRLTCGILETHVFLAAAQVEPLESEGPTPEWYWEAMGHVQGSDDPMTAALLHWNQVDRG